MARIVTYAASSNKRSATLARATLWCELTPVISAQSRAMLVASLHAINAIAATLVASAGTKPCSRTVFVKS